MYKILLLISCIFLTSLSFAQTTTSTTNSSIANKGDQKTKTLKLNISNYSLLTIESLKEELMGWKEKVYSVDVNEATKEFTLIHFFTLENRELFDVLNKYNIEKNSIISYK